MDIEKIAILGAGHGGHAVAADLSLAGYKVNIYSRSRERLEPILRRGGIAISGDAREGFAKLNKVTNDIKEAMEDVDLIVVIVPTVGHRFMREALAPYLKDGQTVFLNPGHTGGSLEFAKTLRDLGVKKKIKIGDSATLSHASRCTGPAQVRVSRLIKALPFSALPAKDTPEVIEIVKEVFPAVVPAVNVLETGLSNVNAVEHPSGMLMNAGWIEHTRGSFCFYSEGITPSVARVCEALDTERLGIMRTLGLRPVSFVEIFFKTDFSSLKEGSIYESLQASEPNKFVKSPDSLKHRYVDEDVGHGLVPMALIGHMISVTTPVMNSLINLASVINNVDYWKEGRTLEKMGIDELSIEELNQCVTEGYA